MNVNDELDAIEARQELRRGYLNAYVDGKLAEAVADGDAACALVRRLQQEKEELRADIAFYNGCLRSDSRVLERVCDERNAARGRVEELTEALRALVDACDLWAGEDMPDGQTLLPRRVERAIGPARALLARVDPEKETP